MSDLWVMRPEKCHTGFLSRIALMNEPVTRALTYLPDLRGCQACAASDELAFCPSTKGLLKSFEASREDMSEPVTV